MVQIGDWFQTENFEGVDQLFILYAFGGFLGHLGISFAFNFGHLFFYLVDFSVFISNFMELHFGMKLLHHFQVAFGQVGVGLFQGCFLFWFRFGLLFVVVVVMIILFFAVFVVLGIGLVSVALTRDEVQQNR